MRLVAAVLVLGVSSLSHALDIEEAFRVDLPRLESDEVVEVEADRLIYDRETRRAEGEGNFRLSTETVTLWADAAVLDARRRFALATGEVVVEEGPRRLLASRLELELDAEHAIAWDALLTVIDPRTGEQQVSLQAGKLERIGRDLILGERVDFTPCDCPGDCPPSWSISARRVRIVPDRGAWLFGSAFRVLGRPVLPLPVFYFPLGERRSGLLTPRVGYSGQNGWRLSQPLYLALGRSWDMTVAMGRYAARDTWEDDPPVRPGVSGLEQTLEVRWAPARRARGVLFASHVYDVRRDGLDPESPTRGSRGSLRAEHNSRFDRGGFGVAGHGLHANVNLLTDASLLADLNPTLEQTQRGYIRSTARAHATLWELLSIELGSRWLQDIRTRLIGPSDARRVAPLFGEEAPATAQLLPEIYAGLAPVTLAGPIRASSDLRLMSWRRPFGPEDRGAGVLHARNRADLSYRFGGDLVTGRLGAGLRSDLWQGQDIDVLGSLYPRFDASLHTGFERSSTGFAHRLRPGLEWRLVPFVAGQRPEFQLDAFDRAVGADGMHQIASSISSELWFGRTLAFDATIQQGVHIEEFSLADLETRFALQPPRMPHRLEANAGWDWSRRSISHATASGRVRGQAGALMQARWTWVQPEGSTSMLAGLDEMFAAGALPPPPLVDVGVPINELALGFTAPRVRGLGLRYSVSMELIEDARPPQHRAGISYISACRCWSGSVLMTWPPGVTVPEFVFALELAGLGAVDTR